MARPFKRFGALLTCFAAAVCILAVFAAVPLHAQGENKRYEADKVFVGTTPGAQNTATLQDEETPLALDENGLPVIPSSYEPEFLNVRIGGMLRGDGWGLANLIMLGCMLAVPLVAGLRRLYKRKRVPGDISAKQMGYFLPLRTTILLQVGAVVLGATLFLLLENFRTQLWFSRWTPVFMAFVLAQALFTVLGAEPREKAQKVGAARS